VRGIGDDMPPADVTITTKKPEAPKSDFAFYVNFKRGEGSASRVFAATHDFIKACERLDKELVSSIDSNIETVMMLEDIEAGSLKTWLKNSLRATDDQALKDLDWKPQVGKYLVRAKYLVLQWIDDDEAPRDLSALGRNIQKLASETDVRHMPDYSPIDSNSLLRALGDFQGVKDHLIEGDQATIITPEGDHDMNLIMRWDVEDIQALAVKEIQPVPVPSMNLVVKRPDYLGTSKWDLRHGKRNISAKIEDEDFLAKFQGRRVDVRPGDALRCKLIIEYLYGHDNELLSERYTIEKVHEVLENQFKQIDMFGDGD